jgi:glycosyltransferase involved in cell wall biosynthesis
MRVLLLSQYFAPEVTAASFRLAPLAEQLAARGHEVEVVCEVPNHPQGVVHEGYRGRPVHRRRLDGFDVSYVWVRASPEKTQRSRLLFYGSYALMATLVAIASQRPDVVLASSPPLPVAAAGMAAARLRRVPWVMDVRDPWPGAAVALGELSNPRLIGALERLERTLYRSAKAIVTTTEPFAREIGSKSTDPQKVLVVPNGTTDAWIQAGNRDEDRAELGMPEDRFVITFAGNVGLAQGLESALDAARLLDDRFQLQIVGSGPRLASLRERVASLPTGRVVFRGLVEPALAARYVRASDASLVSLGSAPERLRSVPVKLFDCCAAGRPVVLTATTGEAARLAGEAEAALCVPPEDAEALAKAVRRLREDANLRENLVRRGRAFAQRNRRAEGIDRFVGLLDSLVAGRRRPEAPHRPTS